MVTVMVVGAFDPIHEGHIQHIVKASGLGDYLLVVTHKRKAIEQKKGYEFQPFSTRQVLLEGILLRFGIKGEVICALEDDLAGKNYNDGIGDTIRAYKPQILAKGGDRTATNMPEDEVKACEEVGCQIVYGVGGQLNSSSDLVRMAMEKLR